jgi:hypothetical protein
VYRQISWQDLTIGSAINPTCQQGMMIRRVVEEFLATQLLNKKTQEMTF